VPRKAVAILAVLIAGLAIASTVLLISMSYDPPLQHAYACDFRKSAEREWQLPRTPCVVSAPAATKEK
jgi:hypothetical protein